VRKFFKNAEFALETCKLPKSVTKRQMEELMKKCGNLNFPLRVKNFRRFAIFKTLKYNETYVSSQNFGLLRFVSYGGVSELADEHDLGSLLLYFPPPYPNFYPLLSLFLAYFFQKSPYPKYH
jgi:hypothetical protein